MGPVTRSLSLPAGLGGGKCGTKLSHGPGHAVPGNVRTGKETWLVRVLNEPVSGTTSACDLSRFV